MSYSSGTFMLRMRGPDLRVPGLFVISGQVTMPPETVMNLDALLSTEQAALQAGVAKHVIRTWRTRGWLDPAGNRRQLATADHDWRGRPLHRLGDLLDAERQTRRSGKSFRRCAPPDSLAA